jgi:cyclic beta-1,2-glucan synthetase
LDLTKEIKEFFFMIKFLKFLTISMFLILAVTVSSAHAAENDTVYNLLQAAGEKGSFNIGVALGDVTAEFDESVNKDVIKFDYTIYSNSIIGVWTKSFPPKLGPSTVDAVRFVVKVPTPQQVSQVAVKLELKGEGVMQTVPIPIKAGWNYGRAEIDWNRIGPLKEVVFVVSPTDGSKRLDGLLYFDLDFYKLTALQKYFIFVKFGAVILLAVLAALLAAIAGRVFGWRRKRDSRAVFSGIFRDILYGIVAVSILACAISVYSLGTVNSLETGFNLDFLILALAGAAIAQALKLCLTGKNLTALEAFQNILFTGFLAASSAKLELLQAPSSWTQVLAFSNIFALVAFLAYHIFNARCLAMNGKHIRFVTGALMTATPYLFNWILLLQNAALVRTMADTLTLGLLSALPMVLETIGRTMVVFIFNEIVTNGIGLITKNRWLSTLKAHLFILFVSLGVVIAPLVADLGSSALVAGLPEIIKIIVCIVATMLSYAGLWGEVYLITGILLDGGHRVAPSWGAISKSVNAGMKKGMAYSGILLFLLYTLYLILKVPASHSLMSAAPSLVGLIAGALVFPLAKTIIETFDGSQPFFMRARYSYSDWTLYARGAIVGFGFATLASGGFIEKAMSERIAAGALIGLLASGGISFLRDALYGTKKQGRVQTWKLYLVDSVLGAFIGGAVAFYLDTLQVPVVIEKFKLYVSPMLKGADLHQFNAATFSEEGFYRTWPLVNKWGFMNLGQCTGGAKLLFQESLAGVINWAIAAWLFAINKVFMQAYFEKDTTPIKFFFSKAGFAQLIEHMLYVLRWGLWMSPIIFTFLRMMPDPTWYNQDGAIHTVTAIYNNFAMSPEAFRQWSLTVFVWLLSFDFFRVLIWMDHMGLRVATLVNLSFLGLDRLDEKVARWIGPAAAQRYIPEAVKRFATWAPLLIPFYIPRGKEWDYAWDTSCAIQNAAQNKPTVISMLGSLDGQQMFVLIGAALVVSATVSFGLRALARRGRKKRIDSFEMSNREYKVVARSNGEVTSELLGRECDISRRSYDGIDPSGRILFVLDASAGESEKMRYWPVVGNFPHEKFEASRVEKGEDCFRVINSSNGVRTTVEITLPDQDTPAECWKITLENMTDKNKQLKVVPYLEWVLNGGLHDRFHTQYARLYPEMEYASQANAVISWQKSTRNFGFLASDIPPEGFSTSRADFIGRARSIWGPRILETLDFLPPKDTSSYPTFDPVGSLLVNAEIRPRAHLTMNFIMGYAKDRKAALDSIKKHLKSLAAPARAATSVLQEKRKRHLLIGHGEIPQGTPQPYYEFIDRGNKLWVRTPFTPRPVDHTMSNAVHSVIVTNRGLHTSSNGNSQQNRLTPDWPDTITKEIPTEALYLYDSYKGEWFSPTYQPLNDNAARNEAEFGVDGTAVFRMEKGSLSTELTVFVPPEDTLGAYLLTIKNKSDKERRLRVAPYFQMVLAFQPERSGPLVTRRDKSTDALYFENPRNMFRKGCAFASMTLASRLVETNRGRFFGSGRTSVRPYFVEKGEPDVTQVTDDGQIASFLGELDVPARGERTIAVILGQADTRKEAAMLVRKYKDIAAVRRSLEETRRWWLSLMDTLSVQTNSPEFDRFQNWLKYQALAERIWARRGFYQTSGAYGFRDQLQDTVNLIWVDPKLARKQIILHASQQFLEGDVYHWFFTLVDGRNAFSCRSHASDNPVWLVWGAAEYISQTGDHTILDEMTSYVFSEFPFAKLPRNKQGWGHLYQRTTRADTVYKHCMRSIDLLLKKRMGKHGLPLMGVGDWNDGLDEIGSEGRGESVWLGFFLYYILKEFVGVIEKKDGARRAEYYRKRMDSLKEALEKTWRGDRYLRAFHDDGTEIGVKGSGVWEIDALTAAWAVMSGINFERGQTIFHTALSILEKDNTILLGWPALREDTKPYLGRSSKYPEGVRENGMYCHGVQWLVKAARILSEEFEKKGDSAKADEYRRTAYRLWLKISPISHMTADQIEIYGGQPNKQAADMLTNFEPGRMIWHGYTGAAGWMLRQAFEGVIGASLVGNELVLPADLHKPRGSLKVKLIQRDVSKSPIKVLKPC